MMTIINNVHVNQYQTFLETCYKNKPMRLCIIDPIGGIPGLLSSQSTKAQVIAREANFGIRGSIQISDIGTYDKIDSRWEVPHVEITLTASGMTAEYYQVFTLIGGSTNAPKSFNSGAINPTTDTIAVNNHGLINGDLLMIVESPGSTLPTPLMNTVLYQAFNATTNTFQISENGLTPVNLTAAGTGNFWLKYGNGMIGSILTHVSTDGITPVLITLPTGQSRRYEIGLNLDQI